MSEHVTQTIIEQFSRNELSPGELLYFDKHVAECIPCRQAASVFSPVGDFQRVASLLTVQPGIHLTYEQLEGIVDSTLSAAESRYAQMHLDACGMCRDDLSELAVFAANTGDPAVPATHTLVEQLRAYLTAGWVPLTAAAGILIFAGVAVWYQRTTVVTDGQAINVVDEAGPNLPVTVDPEIAEVPDVDSEQPAKVPELKIRLIDGPDIVGLDEAGDLVGYQNVPQRTRRLLVGAFRNGTVGAAPELRELESSNGTVMGGPSGPETTFNIIGPTGKVLLTDRPTFQWKALAGSTGYRVDVFDIALNKVVTSELLTTNKWSPRLARGRTYIWQVTAIKEGKEYRSPQRPAPEARFRILDASRMAEIGRLRKLLPRSRLALALAYAEAGLSDDALRELRFLAQKNPDSEMIKKLIAEVRSRR